MKEQINKWLAERRDFLDQENMKEADAIEEKIVKIFRERHEEFECDFILETYTHFGAAPSLIYDDNGMWAVLSEGTQPVVYGDDVFEGHVDMMFFCNKDQWFDTIRGAVTHYLMNRD